jgi:phage-related protein
MLVDASIAIIMALAEGLITALPILIEKLPIIIDKLIVAITDNLPKLLEMGIILILKLAEGLMKAIPQLIEKIPMIIASLISGFASLYSKLANVGIDLITKVRDGFVSKVLEFKDIGINMVKGLWEGIKNSTTWLLDKIKGFGADVMNGIKDFFGIHSPSSLMEAEVGKNLGLGVASGITKSGLTIKDAFKNVIPTDLDATLSYNANFLNPPERTNSIIDYSSLKRVFVEALKEMNLSVALDGYKVGEIIKNTVIKEVFA